MGKFYMSISFALVIFLLRSTTRSIKYPLKLDAYARASRPSLSSSMRDFSQSLSDTWRLHKAQIRGQTAQIPRESTTTTSTTAVRLNTPAFYLHQNTGDLSFSKHVWTGFASFSWFVSTCCCFNALTNVFDEFLTHCFIITMAAILSDL